MKVKDETGKTYEALTVLERDGSICGKAAWRCRCKCGRTKTVTGDALRQGQIVSCGECDIKRKRCAEVGKSNLIDLTGQRFGRLVVLERAPAPEHTKRNSPYWKCQCDCGNIHLAESSNLRRGYVCSCGCLKSKGEEKISSLLQKYKVNFHPQYTEKRFRFSTNYLPHYDFAIFDDNDKLLCLIEYNGEQHYNYRSEGKGWNNKELFLKTQRRDKEKKEICEKFQIKLYIISYKDFDKLEEIVYNIITEINEA